MIFSILFSTDEASHGVWLWASHFIEDMDKLERMSKRTRKISRVLGNTTYEQKLKELGLFRVGKKGPRKDLLTVFTYRKDCSKQRGGQLFFAVTGTQQEVMS